MFDPGLVIKPRLRPDTDWEDDTTSPLHTASTIGLSKGTYPTLPAREFPDAGGQALIDELES